LLVGIYPGLIVGKTGSIDGGSPEPTPSHDHSRISSIGAVIILRDVG
jgi:hypothetical protein